MTVADPLDCACGRRDVEAPTRAHGNPAHVGAGLLPSGHHGAYQVPGGEAEIALRPWQAQAWEAVGVGPGAGVAATPGRLGHEHGRRVASNCVDLADAEGVQGVGLGEAAACPVPLGAASGRCCDRQAGPLELPPQRPAGGVDSSSVVERGLQLSEDAPQGLWLVGQELLYVPVPFGLVAGHASEHKVRGPVAAAPGARTDVVDVQDGRAWADAARTAVGTAAPPFLEQVLAYLVAGQSPLLVLDTGDPRTLEGLCVEAGQLHGDGAYGHQAAQLGGHGDAVVHAVAQARGEPGTPSPRPWGTGSLAAPAAVLPVGCVGPAAVALGRAAVGGPRGAVAQVGRAPAAAVVGALVKVLPDELPTVFDLGGPDAVQFAVGVCPGKGDAGVPRPRVYLQL